MKKLLLMMMALVLSVPIWAGEKTVTISRNEGIYEESQGVYYCSKDGITMTFSSGMNNINYLVEHQQVIFYIRSDNYVIKKIKFNCLDNTTDDNLDCFYWGPSTIHELEAMATYTPTGTYSYSGYIGTWVAGAVDSKDVKFRTEGKPVRFGSVEITYEKEFGDIYDLVTQNSEIQNNHTYVLVSKYDSRALGKEEYHGSDPVPTFSSTPVTLLNYNETLSNYMKVKVTDEVTLMKLQSSGNSDRPWYIRVGDNYLRRRSGSMQGSGGAANGQGYNIYTVPSIQSGTETYYRTRISVENTNNNALITYYHNSSETPNGETFAIRHYNGGDLFRVIDYKPSNNEYATNQRVYLYKPADNFEVTTECLPDDNSGYITLGGGVLTDSQGRDWSQHFDNVTFFVGATDGWGIGDVTVTNLVTNEVTVLQPVATSDFGNDYSFEMPEAAVHIVANFTEPHVINTVVDPADAGEFTFLNGYTDFNGQTTSNEGKTVTFTVDAAAGYEFNSLTLTDPVAGTTTTLTPDGNGVYSFVMPDNDVTLTANFDLIPTYTITTECLPANDNPGEVNVHTGVTVVDNVITSDVGHLVTFWVGTHPGWLIDNVTVTNLLTNEQVTITEVHSDSYGADYQFTMPIGDVHIQANFRPYDNLYLLGTAMGRTSWVPAGPKFDYDPVNDEYYLDVYFKGGFYNNPNQSDEDYYRGFFSFATGIDTGIDWTTANQGNWNLVTGRRVADYNNYNVTDGSTAQLYTTDVRDQNNAFRIPTGVYRIKVNRNLTQMSIVQTPLHIYFDPEDGSIVDLGQVVTITSDINDIVLPIADRHGINEQPAIFNSSLDGVNYTFNSNTETITGYGETTVYGLVNIAYIEVTGSATYTVPQPVYYDIHTEVTPSNCGTITVQNQAQAGDIVNFTVNISEFAEDYDYVVFSVTVTNETTEETTTLEPISSGNYSFTMPNADVTITAEFRKTKTVTIDWTPQNGGVASLASTGSDHSDQPVGAEVTFYVSPNEYFEVGSITGVNYTDNEDGSYTFTMPNSNVAIHVTFVPVGEYQINVVNNPAEGGNTILTGHVKTESGNYYSDEGQTVIITPSPTNGWAFDGLTVVDAQDNPVPVTDNGDGTYTLVMPASDVTITSDYHFIPVPYGITTRVNPNIGGFIYLQGDAADNQEYAGQTVTFMVDPVYGYTIDDVYFQYGGTNYPVTDNGDGTYSFVMPGNAVTVVADVTAAEYVFRKVLHTRDIVEGGKYIYVNTRRDLVLSRNSYDLNKLVSRDVLEWIDDDLLVRVDGTAAIFELVNVVDTTYTPQSSEYGILGDYPYKAAYLKYSDRSYIGLDPTIDKFPRIFTNVNSPSDLFNNLRAQMRINEDYVGTNWHEIFMTESVWSYYGYIWPNPLMSTFFEMTYLDDYANTPSVNSSPSLYKLPEPYVVRTQSIEDGWGSVTILDGVTSGNIAMDGDVVTVSPEANPGYGFRSLYVTIDGTNETIEVTPVHEGLYRFVMPAGDVTVTAVFEKNYTITTICDPVNAGEFNDVFVNYSPNNKAFEGDNIWFLVFANDYYVLDYVEMTNTTTGESVNMTATSESVDYYSFEMPASDVVITAHFLPAHKVTLVVDPDEECGTMETQRVFNGAEGSLAESMFFANGETVNVFIDQNSGYLLDHVTVIVDGTEQQIDASLFNSVVDEQNEYVAYYWYTFTMPDADVTVTAYFELNTPLRYIENEVGPESESEVVVTDELIGTWAALGTLWAKDQSQRSNDFVEIPEDQRDYVTVDLKMQKHEWDQSNWVQLIFDEIDGWTGSESDLIRVEQLVDHKIKAGTIKGIYFCDGDSIKGFNMIVLSEWPEPADPRDEQSLGYPGYMADPREEITSIDYMYNHYVPSNFMKEYIGGKFGKVPEDGVVPGNEEYSDVRMFFLNPKDSEVAQVWAVWLGWMDDIYNEFTDGVVSGDVFEFYQPYQDATTSINAFGLSGAFYVPTWEFNRRSPDRYDFGKPGEGDTNPDNALVPNTAYLFHVAISSNGLYKTPGEPDEPDDPGEPDKAPRRGPVAGDVEPWPHYQVYPLDLSSHGEGYTVINEVLSHEASEIVSIRYYNMMGQESKTPFDGVNIMVVRYKDGSLRSSKIIK